MINILDGLIKVKNLKSFFSLAILLPGFPDDLLCMIAGLTSMSTRKFMMINILCKPIGLFFYSYGIKELLGILGQFF